MKLYTSHLNNLEVQKKSELMWSCGHSAIILCHLYAHLIHMLNCFGCSQWWFVPVAVLLQRLGLISCLFCQVSAFVVSHYIITLCQMWRSGSDEFDQLQQEKFGFFLGASKLGSDRWWVFLSKVACFVTCLARCSTASRVLEPSFALVSQNRVLYVCWVKTGNHSSLIRIFCWLQVN